MTKEQIRLEEALTCPPDFIPIANGDFLGLDLPPDVFNRC